MCIKPAPLNSRQRVGWELPSWVCKARETFLFGQGSPWNGVNTEAQGQGPFQGFLGPNCYKPAHSAS